MPVTVGFDIRFVHDKGSLSADKGTAPGLHFQAPPIAQDKRVGVAGGSILDVAVDLWWNSSAYGQHASVVLAAQEWNQVLVPVGFADGFMSRGPDTEVIYKVSDRRAGARLVPIHRDFERFRQRGRGHGRLVRDRLEAVSREGDGHRTTIRRPQGLRRGSAGT